VNSNITPATGRGRSRWQRLLGNRAVIGFVAGALGVLSVHQALVWLLHALGFAPWPAYRLDPTRPFGVPHVLSAAFWGGVWGVFIYRIVSSQVTRGRAWVTAISTAAFLPTLAGAVLIALHAGASIGDTSKLQAVAASIITNGAWGASILFLGSALDRRGEGSLAAGGTAASERQRRDRS